MFTECSLGYFIMEK